MARYRLGQLPSSCAVTATPNRSGDEGRRLAQGQTSELSKIRSAANPFDPEWDAYFADRDKQQVRALTSVLMAKVHHAQDGRCSGCRQMIQHEEDLVLHHRDGDRKNFKVANLVQYHPNCHAQRYNGPDSQTESSRPTGRLSRLSRIR